MIGQGPDLKIKRSAYRSAEKVVENGGTIEEQVNSGSVVTSQNRDSRGDILWPDDKH